MAGIRATAWPPTLRPMPSPLLSPVRLPPPLGSFPARRLVLLYWRRPLHPLLLSCCSLSGFMLTAGRPTAGAPLAGFLANGEIFGEVNEEPVAATELAGAAAPAPTP